MASNSSQSRYLVIVIGGGIGGLAVSILVAQQGHPVAILERRARSYVSNSNGGIAIWDNARRIVAGVLDLERELASISDDTKTAFIKKHDTGEVIFVREKARV
jgi:2-polyprenyl-6-methoxyphenol hydroxylase-like FAD-dependent oxidoreductase